MSIRQLTTQDGRVVHLRHSTPTIYSWDDGTLVDTTADDIPITFGVTGHCKRWFANGVIHRESGPAELFESNGPKFWYSRGRLHRTDGPAYVSSVSPLWPESVEWYVEGQRVLSMKEFLAAANLSHDDATAMVLKHGMWDLNN